MQDAPDDWWGMRCDDCREALSARLDGEALPPGIDDATVDAHVAGCAGCRTWEATAVRVARTVRVQPVADMPDLWPGVRAAAASAGPSGDPSGGPSGRSSAVPWARWLLAGVAVAQLLLAVPAAVLGQGDGLTTHLAREVGAFDLALAVGFLYAALRPAHAAGLVPFVAALVACHIVAAGIDVGLDRTHATEESTHVLEIAGLVLLWALAHGDTIRRRRSRPA